MKRMLGEEYIKLSQSGRTPHKTVAGAGSTISAELSDALMMLAASLFLHLQCEPFNR
jgi:hypothetical protein